LAKIPIKKNRFHFLWPPALSYTNRNESNDSINIVGPVNKLYDNEWMARIGQYLGKKRAHKMGSHSHREQNFGCPFMRLNPYLIFFYRIGLPVYKLTETMLHPEFGSKWA